MGRIFGTDGVRGVANTEISCTLAMNLGRAAAMVVAERKDKKKPRFLVAKDTRISSDLLESAIAAGLCSVGADVVQIGIMPTPALAYLTSKHADAGIMLSASHNPFEFNGIKIFGEDGQKLTDDEEFEIEAIVLDEIKPYPTRWGHEVGSVMHDNSMLQEYIDHLASTVPIKLDGIRIAVDCANGSASTTAERLFEKLGANADIRYDVPNGININLKCGSTHIGTLSKFVVEKRYDIGIAFDGDADRCILVDELGNEINGDSILAILSQDLLKKGQLNDNTVVATVMSNLGFMKYCQNYNIHLETTKVGDRHVLECINRNNYSLGGEQSGHVIQRRYMPTGDGQLSAIQVLRIMKETGKKLSELASVMTVYPQCIVNVHADPVMKSRLSVDAAVEKAISNVEQQLGDNGRVLVRASGTEPLIRIMIEGKEEETIKKLATGLSDIIYERLSDNEQMKRNVDV